MDDVISEEDTFKILVATDNHLGYKERDPIRGNDSMNTFEEILCIAQENEVDFILLGGDLFHENKPSRQCLHSCMTLLRKYCMGDNPVQFEFVSDQSVNFKHNRFPVVNYKDPNLNISIPVFSIHGNHDDPVGNPSHCALDLLCVSGLVNYFGKYVHLENVQISPILLQKGKTKLALYGLGSIRDERLHRLFNEGNVSMLRPRQDTEDWFNIFVIHQNRYQRGTTSYIPENFLDDFLDLVIWGHEHECLLKEKSFESSNTKEDLICQPGSSIATSLSPGEAFPKHVGLLKVNRKSFEMKKIRLQTVRPFVYKNDDLSQAGLDLDSPDVTERVMDYCTGKIECLLKKAQREKIYESQPDLPLIRLRVEHADSNVTFNTYSLGLKFLNKVANPKDIVLFKKRRVLGSKSEPDFDKEQFETSGMDKIQIEDLISEHFSSSKNKSQLSLLSERRLRCALNKFVQKEEKSAISSSINSTMQDARKFLQPLELSSESIDAEILRFVEKRDKYPYADKEEVESIPIDSRKGGDTSTDNANDDMDELDENDIVSPDNARGRVTRERGGRSRARASRDGTRGDVTRGGRGSKSMQSGD